MSQKEDDGSSVIILALAMFGAFAMVFMVLVFAVLAFLALVFTIVALCAWNKPRKIGNWVATPDEARGFIFRGLIGAAALPAFVVFAALLFNLRIDWDAIILYLIVGGYTAGSIGVDILRDGPETATQKEPTYVHPPQITHAPPSLPRPARQEMEFQYASWDDEEET